MSGKRNVVARRDVKNPASPPAGKGGREGEQIIEFSEIRRNEWNAEPLAELRNEEIIIEDVEFTEGVRGNVTILITDKGRFYTFSEVIRRQAERIKEYIEKGYKVSATVKKVRNYYTLA